MPRRVKVCQEAVRPVVESLEQRVLLTTIVGGGIDPVTGLPLVTQRRYVDAAGHTAVISVGGNTTAEFIFAHVPAMSGRISALGDLVPPPPPNMTVMGDDLFSIYVSQSDANSFISVTEINTANGNPIPFNGGAGGFRVNNAQGGPSVVVNANGGTGQLLLGARTKSPAPGDNIAIVSRTFSGAFGVRPDLGRVTAGLQIAPGLDFGKFFFGGTVIGQVVATGSIDSIYAGNLWTGDARGITAAQFLSRRSINFSIGGDLHSLLVSGSIGTHNDAALDQPVFKSGFDARVGGQIGQISVGDSLIGGVDAIHGRVTSPFGAALEEVEGRGINSVPASPASGWFRGFLEGDASVNNDTFASAQALPSYAGRKGRSTVTVFGQLQADPRITDYVDYYSMPLLAGQAMTVQLSGQGGLLTAGLINIGIYDPDGRLVATDYPNVPGLGLAVEGLPVRFVADRPGLYRIAVAVAGDGDFNGPGGEFGAANVGNVPYQVVITGAGDVGIGGILAVNNIQDGQTSSVYGFFVENGDMGAIEAGGSVF
ncbi:MAG: hypothetical protein JWN40_5360, partial [Phycisphaerales bacterium]|nr:hypothetical protein [Phycisphaerales bacterium]